jgi:hypothetical protein
MSGKTSNATNGDEQLLESLMMQIRPIYRSGGDRDLGPTVAAQMREVCDRLACATGGAGAIWGMGLLTRKWRKAKSAT